MTKLHQLRYTTYSHPDSGRPSAGNLISLYGDEDSFYGPQEPIVMEVVSRKDSVSGAAGGFTDIVLGFLGSSSDGFAFKIYLSTGEVLYQSTLSTSYEDRGVALKVPILPDGTYDVWYTVSSPTKKAKSARLQKDSTNVSLTISGKLGAGSVFYPTSGGTVYRIQDGSRVLFNSQGAETSTIGTSGTYISGGNLRYEDHFPYYVFNIPNSTSANYVFRLTTRPGLGLPVKQPDIMLIKDFTQLPVEGETVYRGDGQVNREDPSWAFSGAGVISPARTDFTLGYVEYDIPDDTTGYILILVSSGLPYLSTPYRDNFSGNNYRDTERLVTAKGEIRSKDGPATFESLNIPSVIIDTSEVYDNSPELIWELAVGEVKKSVHKSRQFIYTGTATEAQVTVGGRVYKGTGTTTIKPILITGVTTTQPQNITYSSGLNSAATLRQSQTYNPWTSAGISISLFAYKDTPQNPYVFDTRLISTSAEGLPSGLTFDLSPSVTYGSSVDFIGTVRNNSSNSVKSGEYPVVVKFKNNTGAVLTQSQFTLIIEPKINLGGSTGGPSTQPVGPVEY